MTAGHDTRLFEPRETTKLGIDCWHIINSITIGFFQYLLYVSVAWVSDSFIPLSRS